MLQRAYNEWHSKYTKPNKEDPSSQILKYLRAKPERKILDISCGKGNFIRCAMKRRLYPVGIDISKKAIYMAKSFCPDSETMIGAAENLPMKDECFDYVTCIGSLEHYLHPDQAIKEIVRVLKPGGLSCILVPNSYFIGHIYMVYRYGIPPSEGFQSFSEEFGTRIEWENLLKENGLIVLRTFKYNKILASRKAGMITTLLYNLLLAPITPLNLSYAFIFICTKRAKCTPLKGR